MSPSRVRAPSPTDSDARFDITAPRSILPVAMAAVAIAAAAVLGLYRGVVSVRDQAAGAKAAPTTDAIVGATPAVALPHNPDWSTLSGPQVLPPPVAKVKKAEDEAASDDSSDEASQAAQAVSPDLAAPADATTSPPAAKPAQPTSLPQPDPQG